MISYRKACDADIPDLVKLCKECVAEVWSERAFKSELEKGSAVIKAVDDGKIVGFGVLEKSLDFGYLHLLAVADGYRRQGIAKLILEHLHNEAKGDNIDNILLEVRCSNEGAISLYKAMDYKVIACRKGFYSSPAEDGFTMQKELK